MESEGRQCPFEDSVALRRDVEVLRAEVEVIIDVKIGERRAGDQDIPISNKIRPNL